MLLKIQSENEEIEIPANKTESIHPDETTYEITVKKKKKKKEKEPNTNNNNYIKIHGCKG